MKEERGLIFLHMMKAAGTTLRTIIARQYPPRVMHVVERADLFCKLPEQSRARIRVLQGHMPFGLHQHLSVPADYITVLRDPVDRLISLYYWAQTPRGGELYEKIRGMSLLDFADSGLPLTLNQQTRFISGLTKDHSAKALETARNNLLVHFAAFGLSERFDESLILFKWRLGWENIFYAKQNVTKGRPSKREVPDSVIDLMRKNNALDVELYAFAQQTFDETIAVQDPSFPDAVRRFQRVNRVYGKFAEGRGVVRGAIPPPLKTFIKEGLRMLRRIRLRKGDA